MFNLHIKLHLINSLYIDQIILSKWIFRRSTLTCVLWVRPNSGGHNRKSSFHWVNAKYVIYCIGRLLWQSVRRSFKDVHSRLLYMWGKHIWKRGLLGKRFSKTGMPLLSYTTCIAPWLRGRTFLSDGSKLSWSKWLQQTQKTLCRSALVLGDWFRWTWVASGGQRAGEWCALFGWSEISRACREGDTCYNCIAIVKAIL